MATNHTEHYQLSQWEPEDSFLREEFNQDHQKIDAALSMKCEVLLGAYKGDGADSMVVPLGFTPRAVLVVGADGRFSSSGTYYGGMAVGPMDDAPGVIGSQVEVAEGGFRVYYTDRNHLLNDKTWHYYIAFK